MRWFASGDIRRSSGTSTTPARIAPKTSAASAGDGAPQNSSRSRSPAPDRFPDARRRCAIVPAACGRSRLGEPLVAPGAQGGPVAEAFGRAVEEVDQRIACRGIGAKSGLHARGTRSTDRLSEATRSPTPEVRVLRHVAAAPVRRRPLLMTNADTRRLRVGLVDQSAATTGWWPGLAAAIIRQLFRLLFRIRLEGQLPACPSFRCGCGAPPSFTSGASSSFGSA